MELELKLLRQANVVASGNQLIYTGNAEFEKHGKGGVHFEGRIAVQIKGGTIKAEGKNFILRKLLKSLYYLMYVPILKTIRSLVTTTK